MKTAAEMVTEFTRKNGFYENMRLSNEDDDAYIDIILETASRMNAVWADNLLKAFARASGQRKPRVIRALRMHLVLEETSELIEAVLSRDEEKVLDACCDLQYVTVGTSVTWGLPHDVAFVEVHRSNMTKTSRKDLKDDDLRLRSKGEGYQPPDIARVIRESRQ